MGHRALVAYRRPDYLYDVRYSHWGGDDLALAEAIGPETPLAGGAVDAALLADSVALERVLTDYLDPCVHEALYLVAPDVSAPGSGDERRGAAADDVSASEPGIAEPETDEPTTVTPYRVLWLEWSDGREQGRGAIVPVEPGPRDVELRGWFRGLKTTLADVIEMGALSRRAAQSYLEARICEDEDGKIYTHSGAADESSAAERSARDRRGDCDDE